MKPLIATVDMPKLKDERISFRNSAGEGLKIVDYSRKYENVPFFSEMHALLKGIISFSSLRECFPVSLGVIF